MVSGVLDEPKFSVTMRNIFLTREDRFRVVELAYRLAHQEGAKGYLVTGGSCSSGSETLKELSVFADLGSL